MATIHDVAKRAGVSIATVSRSLNGHGRVSSQTRERVLAIAESLDFRPNRTARGLVTGRLGNIGVLLPDVANPFYGPILVAIADIAQDRDLGVFLADSREDPRAEERLCRRLVEQVDGLVLVSTRMPSAKISAVAAQRDTVLVNRLVDGVDAVVVDAAEGMRAAVEHLAGLGHRRVLYLDGPAASWSGAAKLAGVREGARASGVELILDGPHPPSYLGGREAADVVRDAGVSAVLAYDDLIAWGVITRLHQLGVDVPGDVSVVGFDDAIAEGMLNPELTTVRSGGASMGATATEMLLRRMADSDYPVEHQRLSCELVVRHSTAPR
ncbi:LacI family DNA-binding transcriptional regulator [Pseudactinotalea sp. Z1748]|uniref:LacI family DNA-binding transcriptional regulator n=1 Tax=Pseudactinotalea sp. Z1748 TaxID=3413027 RepID=UPI003C7AAA64